MGDVTLWVTNVPSTTLIYINLGLNNKCQLEMRMQCFNTIAAHVHDSNRLLYSSSCFLLPPAIFHIAYSVCGKIPFISFTCSLSVTILSFMLMLQKYLCLC